MFGFLPFPVRNTGFWDVEVCKHTTWGGGEYTFYYTEWKNLWKKIQCFQEFTVPHQLGDT